MLFHRVPLTLSLLRFNLIPAKHLHDTIALVMLLLERCMEHGHGFHVAPRVLFTRAHDPEIGKTPEWFPLCLLMMANVT